MYVTKPRLGCRIDWGNPLSRGLVGYWLFNEGAGSVANDLVSPANNRGLLTNFALSGNNSNWGGSVMGGGLIMDGTDDRCTMSTLNTKSIYNDSTHVAWYVDTSSDFQIIMGFECVTGEYGVSMYTIGTNMVKCALGEQGYASIARVTNKLLCQVAVIKNQALYVYMNGILQSAPVAANGTILGSTANTKPYAIGYRKSNAGYERPFKGIVDQAMIYNRALSDEEVKKLYQNPFGVIYSPGKKLYNPTLYGLGAWDGKLINAGASGTLTANSVNNTVEAGMAISFKKA